MEVRATFGFETGQQRQLCRAHHREGFKSIFQEPWWCEACIPGEWDSVEYREDNKAVATFVFAIRKASGVTHIGMPPLARVMMPEVSIEQKKEVTILLRRIKIVHEILHRLPNFYAFKYVLPPDSGFELPFALNGFTTSVEYTFRSHGMDVETVIAGMDQKVRNIIKKSKSQYGIEAHIDFDRYASLSRASFANCPRADRTRYARVQRIFEACAARDRALILSAQNEHHKDIASAIVLWDEQNLYYWQSTRARDLANNNANSLLILAALDCAYARNVTFDMDGYGKPSSGFFLSKFGLLPQRRIIVFNQRRLLDYMLNSLVSPTKARHISPLMA